MWQPVGSVVLLFHIDSPFVSAKGLFVQRSILFCEGCLWRWFGIASMPKFLKHHELWMQTLGAGLLSSLMALHPNNKTVLGLLESRTCLVHVQNLSDDLRFVKAVRRLFHVGVE